MPCVRAKVRIDSIRVARAESWGFWGEPGANAEWYLTFQVNAGGTGGSRTWVYEYVKDQKDYDIGYDILVDLPNESSTITIRSSGYEHDDTSANDDLPVAEVTLPPITNWNIGATGNMYASNDDFEYTVYYTVTCAQATSVQGLAEAPRYAGVWRRGTDVQEFVDGLTWEKFTKKWDELSKKNLRLSDVQTYKTADIRLWPGIFRAGTGGHVLWSSQWPQFKTKLDECTQHALRLVDITTDVDNGQRFWVGVWRAGTDAQQLITNLEWSQFAKRWEALSKQGLRLIDIETYREGNKRLWAGVFRAGTGGHALWVSPWDSFKDKWEEFSQNNLRLVDLATDVDGEQRFWAGVFREGSDPYYLWAGVYKDSFDAKLKEATQKNLRLVGVEIYQ